MFLTRECDYSLRTIRALADGEKKTVEEICLVELIPGQYAYKILKQLERAGFVQSIRGRYGGYRLAKPLDTITIYDIVSVTSNNIVLNDCLKSHSSCLRNSEESPCDVHHELARIQKLLIDELSRKTFSEITTEFAEGL